MLSVPLWARFMAVATENQPLDEIPWEVPAGVKPNDRGGPLKPGVRPPPGLGVDAHGKQYGLPERLQGQVLTGTTPPPGLVPQKNVRIPGAPPRPERKPR